MKQPLLLLLLACLPALFAAGQIINIDKTDTAAYTKKASWSGNVSMGLEIDKQKATLYDASNFFDASLQKNRELFVLSASNRFTYNGPQDFLNTGYVHLRWRHDYKNTWNPESFVQYQWDAVLGMVHRFIAGENVRYNIRHGAQWQIAFATGVFYEDELWDYKAVDSAKIPPSPVNQESRELKSNNYVKWEGQLSPVSSLSAIVFYQAAFNDFWRPRISGVVNLDVTVSKHFSLGLHYSGLYDAGPVVPIFQFYYSFSNSLVYKF